MAGCAGRPQVQPIASAAGTDEQRSHREACARWLDAAIARSERTERSACSSSSSSITAVTSHGRCACPRSARFASLCVRTATGGRVPLGGCSDCPALSDGMCLHTGSMQGLFGLQKCRYLKHAGEEGPSPGAEGCLWSCFASAGIRDERHQRACQLCRAIQSHKAYEYHQMCGTCGYCAVITGRASARRLELDVARGAAQEAELRTHLPLGYAHSK